MGVTAAASAVGPWASRLVSEPVCASLKWDDSKHLSVVAGTQCGNSYSGLSTAVACGRRSVRVSDSFLFMAQLNSKFCDAACRNEVTTKSVPIVRAHRPRPSSSSGSSLSVQLDFEFQNWGSPALDGVPSALRR